MCPARSGRAGARRPALLGCLLLPLMLAMPAGAEDDRDATLLAYFGIWNSGDLDRLDAIVTPDFQRHGGPDESCTSRHELKRLIARARTNFKRFRLSIDDHMTEEGGGAMRGSFYGVHREVDRVIEFPMMSMVRFEDGLIAEEWILANNFLALVGLGFQLTPPGFEVIPPPPEPAALCAVPAPADEGTAAERTMQSVLRAYVDVWTTGEVDRLDDLVTEDFQRHGAYGAADSREQLRRVIEKSRGFYRDFRLEVLGVVANAEKGAVRWRSTGGWQDTEHQLDSLNFSMVRFSGGKISEEWVLGNNMDLFRTFGYRLSPPMATLVPPPIDQPPGPELTQRMAPEAAELTAYAEETLSRAPKNAGELEVRSPVGCRLLLDGQSIGWLQSGGSVVLRLARGEYDFRAASLGGAVFFDRDVVVRKGGRRRSRSNRRGG